jgi:hypothetical protein
VLSLEPDDPLRPAGDPPRRSNSKAPLDGDARAPVVALEVADGASPGADVEAGDVGGVVEDGVVVDEAGPGLPPPPSLWVAIR